MDDNITTEPCPAMGDGSARQCANCETDIPIGEPAARNEFRVFVHPACLNAPRDPSPEPEPIRRPTPALECPTDLDPEAWAEALKTLTYWKWETRSNFELRCRIFAQVFGKKEAL